MKRTAESQTADMKKKLDFEKERLLNLIDSRIRRKELDIAKSLAEELFKTMLEFLLLEKAKRLRRYNKLLLKVLLLLIACLFLSVACTVMNIHPFFNLAVQIVTITVILSLISVNNSLCRRFGKTIQKILEKYETARQPFIEKLLDNFIEDGNPDITLRNFTLLVFR